MTTHLGKTPHTDIAINLARQILYRFAAYALQDPRSGNWRELKQFEYDCLIHETAALLRSCKGLKARDLANGEQPLRSLQVTDILALLPDSPEAFNAVYEQTFGLLVSSPCPPYESEYINSKFVFQRSNALADLNGFYQAFGLKMSDSHPERSDHIVAELEFMAHLIALENSAAEFDSLESDERRQICRDAQEKFLAAHLVWWVPAFGKLLGRNNPGGYYSAVGNFLGAMMAMERTLFHLPPGLSNAEPSVAEASELCEGCTLG